MKKTLKKILSLSLALVMAFGCCGFVLASAEQVTPVIVVSGMNCFPLYSAETGEQVYPPSTDRIMSVVKTAVPALIKFLPSKDWQTLGDDLFEEVYTELFDIISFGDDAESLYSLYTDLFPESVDHYPETLLNEDADEDEVGLIRTAADAVGAENVYFFNYDWRKSPMDHADDLKAYIENVKKERNADQVMIIASSMGGAVTNAFLAKYGSGDLKKIVYAMTAFQGVDCVGELFCRNLEINTDYLLDYLFAFQKGKLDMQILMALLQTGVELAPQVRDFVDAFITGTLDNLGDRAYNEIMAKSFGTLPGLWAMVPADYYANAKQTLFEEGLPKALEAKTDSYYAAQTHAQNMMNTAIEKGTDIYLFSSYGYLPAPFSDKAREQSDCLIETSRSSGGAVTALWGETLGGRDYQAVGTACAEASHHHVSNDGIVDASTCMFPEQTWFFKYNRHVGVPYGSDTGKLLSWLLSADSYVTVHSDERYPQFMSLNRITGKCTSLTGSEIRTGILDQDAGFFVRLLIILQTLFSTIIKLLGL
ncbi:MAG: hypothetical protein PUB43_05755 [Oscillospiraceae bacterium]|nr:hypothetical protein [Oscillospiraceae bacterium]